MTAERTGPRPVEADIARNVADFLDRAHGQKLAPDEAKAVAIDANRPVRPKAETPDDHTEPDSEDEPDEQTAHDPGATRAGTTFSTLETFGGGCSDRGSYVQRGHHAGRLARVRGATFVLAGINVENCGFFSGPPRTPASATVYPH
jgi:hypothetical protein